MELGATQDAQAMSYHNTENIKKHARMMSDGYLGLLRGLAWLDAAGTEWEYRYDDDMMYCRHYIEVWGAVDPVFWSLLGETPRLRMWTYPRPDWWGDHDWRSPRLEEDASVADAHVTVHEISITHVNSPLCRCDECVALSPPT